MDLPGWECGVLAGVDMRVFYIIANILTMKNMKGRGFGVLSQFHVFHVFHCL